MAEEKKFGLLRGLSEIYICEIEDSPEGYTPKGTPEQLIPAGELKVSKSIDKTQVYYDNNMYAEIAKEAPSEMEIVGAAVRPAYLAWLEGKNQISTKQGVTIDDGEAHVKYFAISGRKDYTDGTSEYFWFLKCTYGGAEEATKTKDDSTDASGMTLPFTAYTTQYKFEESNGGWTVAKVIRLDTAKAGMKSGASWTAQVVTPENIAELLEE